MSGQVGAHGIATPVGHVVWNWIAECGISSLIPLLLVACNVDIHPDQADADLPQSEDIDLSLRHERNQIDVTFEVR